jgi:hypothetical protein
VGDLNKLTSEKFRVEQQLPEAEEERRKGAWGDIGKYRPCSR